MKISQASKFASFFATSAIAAATATSAGYAADLGGSKNWGSNATSDPYQQQTHRNLYVRGDVGVGRYDFGNFSQQELSENGGSFISQSIGDTVMIGAGIGVQLNKSFRVDLTGEYRSTAEVKALDNLTATLAVPAGSLQANTLYQGELSAKVGLLNAYWDLFSWRGFTPYVGAGIGLAHVEMRNFTTLSSSTFVDAVTGAATVELNSGVARSKSETNLAWALMAGTSFDLRPNAKLDLGYRYLNLGHSDVATGDINCPCGTAGSPLNISDLNAHEFRIGIRWMLDDMTRGVSHVPLK